MNRSLMLWALLVGSVIGLGEAIAETASPSWAESVGDHWTGLVAMSLVVVGFWVVLQSFTKPTRGIQITLGLVILSYAMMGVVQNIAELIDYNGVVNGNIGLLFLFFSIVLAVSSIVLGMRAWRQAAWPRWTSVIVIVAPLGATVPGAPLLLAIQFPNELLHAFFFAGPFALALGNWRLRPAATRTDA
ncbi:MAG TPA: hypothetical protein VKF16_09590 [Candidatus Dormibacteraeota bacterium]|nr:hypothetical protein [Candidatus Dormibacteraeota bacterium]